MTTHTTLSGFKRAAKNLSKQSKMPLNQALEHQARIEGYANYNHAQRLLRAEMRSFKTTFFQNWQKDRRSVEGGCFEASVWTKRDPLTILTPSARQKFMKLYTEPKQSLYRIYLDICRWTRRNRHGQPLTFNETSGLLCLSFERQ